MIENMSIEQFYLLYKVGEVCKALLVFPAFVGGVAFFVLLTWLAACSSYRGEKLDAKDKKCLKALIVATVISLLVSTPLLIGTFLTPTFGEVKAFAVLKVSRGAANSESAQRLIDVALRRLEAQEKGGEE